MHLQLCLPVQHKKFSIWKTHRSPILSITLRCPPSHDVLSFFAAGVGAHGHFTVTNPDIARYCKASVFKAGKKTPITARFSSVTMERGAADTARDPRGFALKFRTDDGNWDLVANNVPVFFM